jgi:hypothetical protein
MNRLFSKGFLYAFFTLIIGAHSAQSASPRGKDAEIKPSWLAGVEYRDRNAGERLEAAFDYRYAAENISENEIAVRFTIPSQVVSSGKTELLVKGYKLATSTEVFERKISADVLAENARTSVTLSIDKLDARSPYAFTFTLDAAGTPTDLYYAVTSGSDALDPMRSKLATLAFEEWEQYGKRGTVVVSGVRYKAAPGDAWCSEFYAWLTDHWIKGIAGSTWVGDLRDYFKRYTSMYPGTEISSKGRPGDYVAMWGTEHSGMFLALENVGAKSYLWTIDGNWGSKIRVLRRDFKASSFDLGHIVESQLKHDGNPLWQ